MTLLELIVVMAIIATLLGLGFGAFRQMDGADRRAVSQVKEALRAARLFAQNQSAPASVIVDTERQAVWGLGLAAAGNWHFEDPEGTGWPVAATHEVESVADGGVLGRCLLLDDRLPGEQVLLLSELPSSFDSPDGFGVELFVDPAGDPRPMTILERPDSWGFGFDGRGEFEVVLQLVGLESEGEQAGEPAEFRQSLPGVELPRGRWSRLAVVFDGRRLFVSVDGRRVVEDTLFGTPRRLMTAPRQPIGSGAGPTRFRGRLDELRISSVLAGDHEPLPVEVTLAGPSRAVQLDAAGHLDPAFHAGPVELRILHGEPAVTEVVEFGLLGTLRSWTERPDGARP